MEGFLKRYTDLPFLLHILKNKKLALLNPASWEDRNDAYHLERWGMRLGKTPLALCFAATSETFHHWKVFTGGSSGVCIDFRMAKVERWAEDIPGMTFQSVKYKRIIDIMASRPTPDEMPFVKRNAFRDEKEYRLVYLDDDPTTRFREFDFDVGMIDRVVLSPWLPMNIANELKDIIKSKLSP